MIYLVLISTLLFSGINSDIEFKYGILTNPYSNPDTTISLIDSSIVYNKDYLRINLSWDSQTYFYALFKSNDGSYYNFNVKCSLGADSLCYFNDNGRFDNSEGYETIYLVNTTEKQYELENFLSLYSKANSSELERKIGYTLFSLIENDRLIGRMDIGGELEDSFTGGVAFRGDNDKLNNFSITHEFKGKNGIAVKKIILDHQ